MSQPPYRALQVALCIFSVLLAIGALFMIFASRGLVIRVFLHPPEAEVVPLLSLYTVDIHRIYLGHLIWGRSVVRLVSVAFFFYLRLRGTRWSPAGDF